MENKKDLISIITPVYNVESYLERCIESVLNQTYTNFELILINDGSTDKSINICNKYKNIDDRIIVIDKKNEGTGYARNTGLDNSNGEWIFFLDSDDFIESNALETLYFNAINFKADISSCFFYSYYGKDNIKLAASDEDLQLNGLHNSFEFLEIMYEGGYKTGFSVIVCNKLFRKNIFNNLRFRKIIHEDEDLIFKIYLNNYKMHVTSEPLYYYSRENKNSVMQTEFSEKNLIYLDILNERISQFKKMKLNYLYKKNLQLFNNMTIEYYYKMKKKDKEYCFKRYNKMFNVNYNKYIYTFGTNFKDKIRFTIYKINKNVYKMLFLKI